MEHLKNTFPEITSLIHYQSKSKQYYLRSKCNLLQWARSYHGRNGWPLF